MTRYTGSLENGRSRIYADHVLRVLCWLWASWIIYELNTHKFSLGVITLAMDTSQTYLAAESRCEHISTSWYGYKLFKHLHWQACNEDSTIFSTVITCVCQFGVFFFLLCRFWWFMQLLFTTWYNSRHMENIDLFSTDGCASVQEKLKLWAQ